MIYKVLKNKTVNIFVNENDPAPAIIQPTYPNGDEFESVAAAEAWAAVYVAADSDETMPFPNVGLGILSPPRSKFNQESGIWSTWDADLSDWVEDVEEEPAT